MSKVVERRGLDALTEEDWEVVDEMADEYEGQYGDDLRALHNTFVDDGEHDDE